MTSDPSINAPSDEPENGVLAETGAIDTSDLGLLTTNTAHVNVILPTEEDEDDDDVVDDDDISILFDSLLSGDTVTAQQEDVAAVIIDTGDIAEQEDVEPEHIEEEDDDAPASGFDESTSVQIDDELDVVEAEIIEDEDDVVADATAEDSDDDFEDESDADESEDESDAELKPVVTSADDEPDAEPAAEHIDAASATVTPDDVADEESDDDELDEDEEADDASTLSADSDETSSGDESDDDESDEDESEQGGFDADVDEVADHGPDADAFDQDAGGAAETIAAAAEAETGGTRDPDDVADHESDTGGVETDALTDSVDAAPDAATAAQPPVTADVALTIPAAETPAPETAEDDTTPSDLFAAESDAPAAPAEASPAAAVAAVPATQTDSAPAQRKAVEEHPVSESRDIHDLERVTVRTGAVETTPAPRRLGEVGEGASRETPDLLTADRLLDPHRKPKPEPEGAWQHFVYTVSGKRINLGDGKRARERKALTARIAAPIAGGSRFVPVLSRKGGVGKTTVTTLIGMALADARDDRVVAVDANPDRGTLAERISRSSTKTVRDLVRVRDEIRGYNDLSGIVSRDETRLDVLASDSDPRVSEAFSDIDYRHVADVASRYYSIVLTDTGTGIVHSVMGATLDLADQIVIVAGLSVDEARAASETLTWLETNGFSDIARGAIVVLNQTSAGAPVVRMNEVEEHFRTRVSEVVRIPYDPMIASGSAITFRDLQPETRVAARELAALVVNGLRGTSA